MRKALALLAGMVFAVCAQAQTTCTKVNLNMANVSLETGFSWIVYPFGPVGTPADTSSAPTQSTLQLFENSTALGPAHSLHSDIATLGHGRFSHWAGEAIRFAATDNTNPKTNGRTYSYCVPVIVSDATSPTVTITAPAVGGTVVGSVTLSASASDNVGVVGVQFKVDGVAVGAEDSTSPFSVTWNSANVANGSHTISAAARDAAGNTATSNVAITVNNPPAKKTLLYGWLNERWLAATLSRWAGSGFGGFMIAGQVQWFTPAADLETYNRQSFTDLNTNGAQYGFTDNFFVVSLAGQDWNNNNAPLPAWSDTSGWNAWTAGGLTTIANFARTTGTKGIAFDTEAFSGWNVSDPRNGGATKATLQPLVYQRGQQMMQALVAAYPGIQVMLMQEGALWASASDPAYELWPDFYNGMASVAAQNAIILAAESTYPEDPLLASLNSNPAQFISDRAALLNNSMTQYAPNWMTQGSLAIGMRPLGVDYSNKGTRYSATTFKAQIAAAKASSGKYVWVYSHGSAWWQMTQAEIDQYSNNPWHYTANNIGNLLPTDGALPSFFGVVNGTY